MRFGASRIEYTVSRWEQYAVPDPDTVRYVAFGSRRGIPRRGRSTVARSITATSEPAHRLENLGRAGSSCRHVEERECAACRVLPQPRRPTAQIPNTTGRPGRTHDRSRTRLPSRGTGDATAAVVRE